MQSRDFCFWLQGYFEISGSTNLEEEQVNEIKRHLSMVFVHEIDPSFGDEKHQEKLDHLHHGKDKKMRC